MHHLTLPVRNVNDSLLAKCCRYTLSFNQQQSIQLLSCFGGASVDCKSALIDFYCTNDGGRDIGRALNVFQSIPKHDRSALCINCMMKGYIHHQRNMDAIDLFEEHRHRNYLTDILYLKACVNISDCQRGQQWIKQLQCDVNGLHLNVANFTIHFYGHFGDVERALNAYQSIPSRLRNVVSLTSMLNAFILTNQPRQAIVFFDDDETRNNIAVNDTQ